MNEPPQSPLDKFHWERRLQAFSDVELAERIRAERDALYGANVDTQPQSEHNTRSVELRIETGRNLILIREDNQLNVRLFRDVLELAMHCVTISSADGHEALELAYSSAPDLIQTDIQGPNQSGLEFARLLKQDPRTRHIPLVCVSAWAGAPGSEAELLTAGFDAWMSKPISVTRYLGLIHSCLSVPHGAGIAE